jgi:hypothetical protein
MKNGRPTFNEEFAFPNKKELVAATAKIELNGMRKLEAKVWCVKGFIFSIEYERSVSYFEEAAGMDRPPECKLTCVLVADLAAT